MKVRKFKHHNISRSNPQQRGNYRDYRNILKTDFNGRCAYCNLSDETITTPFQIDHFVPRKAFRGKRDDLENDYNNLVYSCQKCNNAKGDKFKGDVAIVNPTNELFYDPALVDYNTIFYRNEIGAIASDDPKGQAMIELLRLYRPIHILGWICEEMAVIQEELEYAIAHETDIEIKNCLSKAQLQIAEQYFKYVRIFTASYNDPKFSIKDLKFTIKN